MPPTGPTTAPDFDLDRFPSPAAARTRVTLALLIGGSIAVPFFQEWFRLGAIRAQPDVATKHGAAIAAIATLIALAIWAIAPANRAVARCLDAIRTPSPGRCRVASVAIALAATVYFYGTALEFGRALVPTWHDTNMHMVQARLLTHGKFWAAPHPLADQLETFFVFTSPVYAAIHFPGTAMLYAPLMALGMPPAVFAALVAGAVVGLTYRIVAEVVDGVAAALVLPLLLANAPLRQASVMLLSHHTLLVPALLGVWAFLRWRRSGGGDVRWGLAIGAFVAFAGITRPVEAAAYAVAIGAGIVLTLGWRPSRRLAKTLGAIALGAAPFIALQLVIDYNITGNAFSAPYDHYVRMFHPDAAFGAGGTARRGGELSIPTLLPQKVDYYFIFIRTNLIYFEQNGALGTLLYDRVPSTLMRIVPEPLLLALWPAAIFAAARRPADRCVLLLTVPAMLLLYVPNVFFLDHYPVAVAPAGVMFTVLGMAAVARAFATTPATPATPGAGRLRRGRSVEVLLVALVFAGSLAGLPQVNHDIAEVATTWAHANMYANTKMQSDVTRPAAVLFRYRRYDQPFRHEYDEVHDEPVYTFDALVPEDSPVARFQDLGVESNRQIYDFFVRKGQGNRSMYLYDRRSQKLTLLGTASELLAHGEPPAYFEYTPSTQPAKDAK